MSEFKQIKEQNFKFHAFIESFGENEKMISDKLKGFKVAIGGFAKKKMFNVDEAFELKDKIKRSVSVNKTPKA